MLLGSGELSRELAIALRRLGARVIAVDEYPHAPTHGVADQSLILPMTDADELSKAIQRLQAGVRGDGHRRGRRRRPRSAGRRRRKRAHRAGAQRPRPSGSPPTGRACAGWPPTSWGCPPRRSGSSDPSANSRRSLAHAGYPLLVKPVAGPADTRWSPDPTTSRPAWQRAVGGPTRPGIGRDGGGGRLRRHPARGVQRRPQRSAGRVLLTHRPSRRRRRRAGILAAPADEPRRSRRGQVDRRADRQGARRARRLRCRTDDQRRRGVLRRRHRVPAPRASG